jgi:YidC/Oxa1 family membrane protein insertase
MQERSASPSLGNILGLVAVIGLVLAYKVWLEPKWFPPPPKNANVAQQQDSDNKAEEKKAPESKKPANKEKPADHEPLKAPGKDDKAKPDVAKSDQPPAPADKAKPDKLTEEPRRWMTLGSVDPSPQNPYRMLVTLSNEGASVPRLELSSERYRDLDDRSGYLGHLAMDNSDRGPGCLVQVVGAGTPAAAAGVQVGDHILELTHRGQTTVIERPASLEAALHATKPGDTVELAIQRGNNRIPITSIRLIRRPLEVMRPERKTPEVIWAKTGPMDALASDDNCPPSLLTTLQQVDGNKLSVDEDPDAKMEEELTQQLPGVELRRVNWKIDSQEGEKDNPGGPTTKVAFSCVISKYNLKFTKTYELVKVDGDPVSDSDAKAYHLVMTLQLTNLDSKPHEVAYRLDGPNGLPIEGAWYATKVQKSGLGLRDVVWQLKQEEFKMVACSELSEKPEKFRKVMDESTKFADGHLPVFFGVDAQYFTAALLPDPNSTAPAIDRAVALRVGQMEEQRRTLTNTSFRIVGKPTIIEPGKSSAPQSYELFAGPKRPALLAKYEMRGLVYFGWPIFKIVAEPMTLILEFFYSIVRNYGLAIILLTIVVRLAMFPVSRKQAQSAQLMQKIQPKLKEIEKKHKGDWKALQQARQEMLAKYNYNPSSGCFLLLLQLPIFIGLYRSLQVDIELRDAPLISHAIRWCSNLAAPDMLYDWSWFMPNAVNSGIGFPGFFGIGSMAGLGPYLNLFPIITLGLFLVQQKVMMPPAADEQAAQQQKIMKYVMFLMGFMFFKVAAGLCIYFIATTLWGVAERKFLPKSAASGDSGDEDPPSRPLPKPDRPTNAEREAIRRKKRGGKK